MALIIPKNNAEEKTLDATLKIYYEADDWVTNEVLIKKLSSALDELGIEEEKKEPQSYTKKTQVLAYYGFIIWEEVTNAQSRRKITDLGKRFFEAKSSENSSEVIEILIESLNKCTFGRNVIGCNSDSDLEPPNIFLKSALLLDGLNLNEFAYILQKMEFDKEELADAIFDVSLNRKIGRPVSPNSQAAKWKDPKPILALGNWGLFFVEKRNGLNHYYLNKNVIELYSRELMALRTKNTETSRFVMNNIDDSFMEYTEKNLQVVYYGAPGTGKSFKTNEVVGRYSETIRTTFHPDSDYSTFVGAYKPTNTTEDKYGLDSVGNTVAIGIEKDSSYKVIPIKEKKIEYKFVKQAFLKAYIKAWNLFKDSCVDGQEMSPQFLVIEEINRGNCAQIFGDLFQLLDRKNGFSEYPIEADEDIQKALLEDKPEDGLSFGEKGLQLTPEQIIYINTQFDKEGQPSQKVAEKISFGQVLVLPPNFYIWATMNTSDQSLFPIDSAFKRRWDWKYVRICEGKKKDGSPLNYRIRFTIPEIDGKPAETVDEKWWDFVKEINKQIEEATKSEDKKLGFFFCKPDKKANDADECNTIISAETFVGKVVFYLWQDVFKDYGFKSDIFKNGDKKISFHDFYPEDMVADETTNPEGIDLALVKTFIYKVIGKKEDKTSEATTEA